MTLIAEIPAVAADASSTGGGIQNWTLLLAAMLALLAFSFALARRARARAAASDEAARQRIAELRGLLGRREPAERTHSFDDLLVQLEDVSRRVNAQLDTKFIKLETVIRDADDRLARAEAVLARLAQATDQLPVEKPPAKPIPTAPDLRVRRCQPGDQDAPDSEVQRYSSSTGCQTPAARAVASDGQTSSKPPASSTNGGIGMSSSGSSIPDVVESVPLTPQRPPPAAQPRRAADARPMPEANSAPSGTPGPHVQSKPPLEQRTTQPRAPSPGPLPTMPAGRQAADPRVQRIYDLADQGLPPIKIAAALNISLGEVEFALNLRKFG